MSVKFIPPKNWFEVANEVIIWAKHHRKINDFMIDAKMKPFHLGESYTYRFDVITELIRSGVILQAEGRLKLGDLNQIDWLQRALVEGVEEVWEFAEAVEGNQSVNKKFNYEILKEIGNKGELHVIDTLKTLLPEDVAERVEHVALYDDTLGFDIFTSSVRNSDLDVLLEVKTSVRPIKDDFNFYLSRNEFNVGRKRKNWCLVCVTISDSYPKILGHIYCYQFESRLPRDVDLSASWNSCKVSVELEMLRPGLP